MGKDYDNNKQENTPETGADNIVTFQKPERPDPSPRPPSEPILNLPPVSKILSLLIITVFVLQEYFPSLMTFDRLYALAFVPERYSSLSTFDMSYLFSPVTHIFLHGGWIHVLFNLGALLAFGAGLEKEMGGRKFILFFFSCGLAGAAAHLGFYIGSASPLIGASGAISGLFAGVLLLMQDNGALPAGKRGILPFAAIWIGISLFFGWFGMPGTETMIAWATHIGGFVAGLALYRKIKNLKNL